MQLHLGAHRKKFKDIGAMMDPWENISYAAKLLAKLKREKGSWEKAVKYYHSSKASPQHIYNAKVFNCWAKMSPTSLVKKYSS